MPRVTPISRRTLLRSAGVALSLPWLESSLAADEPAQANTQRRRLACVFFPNGVSLPDEKKYEDQRWFPKTVGSHYSMPRSLDPLTELRKDISIIGGLDHHANRKVVGHGTCDSWLTGADLSGSYRNSVSIDQLAAKELGHQTRFSSLVMSTQGGVGARLRTQTLSFNIYGQPVPAAKSPVKIFHKLFGDDSTESLALRRQRLHENRSILDGLVGQINSLNTRIGAADKRQIDQYLGSIRNVEQNLLRSEAWLDKAKPEVDSSELRLDAPMAEPADFLRAYYDLMVLAFQTDSTRLSTFQIARENSGPVDALPMALGLPAGWHKISHQSSIGNFASPWHVWAELDRFSTAQFAYFLKRLQSIREGDGTLLDNTMVLYGCATSTTHNATNYPTIVAGGRACGLKHGSYLRPAKDTPFSNVLYTLLAGLQLPSQPQQFSDSTGRIDQLVRS